MFDSIIKNEKDIDQIRLEVVRVTKQALERLSRPGLSKNARRVTARSYSGIIRDHLARVGELEKANSGIVGFLIMSAIETGKPPEEAEQILAEWETTLKGGGV